MLSIWKEREFVTLFYSPFVRYPRDRFLPTLRCSNHSMHSQKLAVTKRHTQQSLLLRGHKPKKTRIVINLAPVTTGLWSCNWGWRLDLASSLWWWCLWDGVSVKAQQCLFALWTVVFFAFWVTVKGGWNMKQKLQVWNRTEKQLTKLQVWRVFSWALFRKHVLGVFTKRTME